MIKKLFIGSTDIEVKLLTNGTVFLVYSLVKNKSKTVATPKARANPLIGPIKMKDLLND